jgi:hypothetical protein
MLSVKYLFGLKLTDQVIHCLYDAVSAAEVI